jgi:hypothetical protein
MRVQNAIPAFGKPLRMPDYYVAVDGVISILRPYSTLRTVSNHLNAQGLKTPTGLEWNRERVAQYIRHRDFRSQLTERNANEYSSTSSSNN